MNVFDFYRTAQKRKTEDVFVELELVNALDLKTVITEKDREYWKVIEQADHERIIKYIETERDANKKVPLKHKIAQWFRTPINTYTVPTGM